MKLWEIDQRLEALLDMGDGDVVDSETGEIVSDEEINALHMERNDILEGWGCWLKNQESDAEAIKREIDNLKARMDRIVAHAERSKSRYQQYLNGEKFKTARVAVSYRKTESVNYTGNAETLPEEFRRVKVEYSPDKTAIKAALKGGGQVEGAELVERISMTIK